MNEYEYQKFLAEDRRRSLQRSRDQFYSEMDAMALQGYEEDWQNEVKQAYLVGDFVKVQQMFRAKLEVEQVANQAYIDEMNDKTPKSSNEGEFSGWISGVIDKFRTIDI